MTDDTRANLADLLAFCAEIPDVAFVIPRNVGGDSEISDFATFSDESDKAEPLPGFADLAVETEKNLRQWTTYTVEHEKAYLRGHEPENICRETIAEKLVTRRDGSEFFLRKILKIENPGAVYIHKYRDNLYKVVTAVSPPDFTPCDDGTEKKEKPPDLRWFSNLARARVAIEEYALCNPWQYFITCTIDGEKLARDDLEKFRGKLSQMIRDLRRNHDDVEIPFLLVPELHPDALSKGRMAWHMHGLVNLPREFLAPFENRRIYGKDHDKFPPRYIRDKIRHGQPIYHWRHYDKAFGNNIVEPVRNADASARYLMKYVSKEQALTASHLEQGQHLYYISRGLKRAQKESPESLGKIRACAKRMFEKHCETCVITWYEL